MICVSWYWSINVWRTPRWKPSSCGSTTPRPICAKRCIAAIREGVTPFRCSCCATRRRAAKRGYAVAASAASLEVGFDNRAPAQTIVFRWGGDDWAREMDVIERDWKNISVPRYDSERGDDCLDGEVATPAVLIEHQDVVAPEAVASTPTLPVWPGPHSPPPLITHLYAPYAAPPGVASACSRR